MSGCRRTFPHGPEPRVRRVRISARFTMTRRDLRPLGWWWQERRLNVMGCVVTTVHGKVQGTVAEGSRIVGE